MAMLRAVTRFVKPYRAFLALAFLGVLGETADDLLRSWRLKLWFDNIFNHPPVPAAISRLVTTLFGQHAQDLLYFVLAAVIGVALLNSVSSFMQDFFMSRVSHWVIHDLRRQLYWHIQRLSLSFHNEQRMGDLLSTLIGYIETLRDLPQSA